MQKMENSSPRQNQGKIITQNPELLSMLQEKSNMDKPLRKVYVQSPAFTNEDENKYRFVSTNVDEFDEDHDKVLNELQSARNQVPGGPADSARFEDRNQKMVSGRSVSTKHEDLVLDRQYVIKSGSNPSSRKSSSNSVAIATNINLAASRQPALRDRPAYRKSPGYSPYNDDPLSDPTKQYSSRMSEEEILAQEARYQEKLRERLLEQEDEISQPYHYVPKLPLADEDEDFPRDSLDYNPYSVPKDSNRPQQRNDRQDNDITKDSLDWEDPPPNPFRTNRDLDMGRFGEDLKEKRLKDQGHMPQDSRVMPLYRGGAVGGKPRDRSEADVTRYSEDSLEEDSSPLRQGSVQSEPVRTGQIQPKPVMSGGARALQRSQSNKRDAEGDIWNTRQGPGSLQNEQLLHGDTNNRDQGQYTSHNPFPQNKQVTQSQPASAQSYPQSQGQQQTQDQIPVQHNQFVPSTQGSLQGLFMQQPSAQPQQQFNPTVLQGQINPQGQLIPQNQYVNPNVVQGQIIPQTQFVNPAGGQILPQYQYSNPQGQILPLNQYANQPLGLIQGQNGYIPPNMQIYGAQGQMLQQGQIQQPILLPSQFLPSAQQYHPQLMGQLYAQNNQNPLLQPLQVQTNNPQPLSTQSQPQFQSEGGEVEEDEDDDDTITEDETPSIDTSGRALHPINDGRNSQVTKPEIDYVEMNKDVKRQKPKGSYNQLFEKRKQQDNQSPTGRPPLPRKLGGVQPLQQPSTANPREAVDPESVWANRSASLARQKDQKTAGSKKTKRKPLKKYPSDSGVNTVSSAPAQIQQPIHSYTEPIKSELAVDPSQITQGRPITHTIFTEDGQRVSVDINLKLLSPPPPPPPANNAKPPQKRRQQPVNAQRNAADSYPSPRDNMSVVRGSPHQGAPMSPYRILPPITAESEPRGGNAKQGDGDNVNKSPQEDGYLAQFKRTQAKKNSYKEYTLDDYRRLKNEIEIMKKQTGGLGPDLANEDLREKRDKEYRKFQYAKEVALKNRQKMQKQALKGGAPDKRSEEESDAVTKRKMALEYAKNVPRPKAKSEVPSHQSNSTEPQYSVPALKRLAENPAGDDMDVYDFSKLHDLQERHKKDKEQAALIRQNLEGVL